MKFQTRRVELPEEMGTTNADERLWLRIPSSLTEGQVRRMRKLGKDTGLEDPFEAGRVGNAEVLKYIEEWNLDDANGAALPLMKAVLGDKLLTDVNGKVEAEANRIMESLPIQFYGWLGRTIVGGPTEGAEGF
jgi:hypothetical protein